MSGEVVQVLGKHRWFYCGTVPAALRGARPTLRTTDGHSLEIEGEALALARATSRLVMQKGPHALINMPFKRAVLGKVLEYLRFHKDIPPAEIKTPLQSENLVECGCSKWDNNYIAVEREVLYDLIVAATIMDIPSLLFLAVAKASLFVRGRTSEKLLKEFKVNSDLPATEETELLEYYTDMRKGVTPDESGLSGVALLTNCVLQAAHKSNLLSSPDDTDSPGPTADSTKSYRLASWRYLVLSDWTHLGTAPAEIVADRPLMLAAIAASQGRAIRYAGPELKKDKKLVQEAVKLWNGALRHADDTLRNERTFVEEAVMLNPASLEGAAEEYRASKDMILWAASKGNGSALVGATNNLKTDPDLVKESVRFDPKAYSYIGEALSSDKDLAIDVAEVNGLTLQYMKPVFRADPDVVRQAILNNPRARAYAHVSALQVIDCDTNGEWLTDLGGKREEESIAYGGVEIDCGPRQAGMPLSKVTAQRKGNTVNEQCLQVNRAVWFSASSTVLSGNMGQANYLAANSFLDKLPFYQRPEVYAVALLWGAVGNVGMRWKAFASMDAIPQENLMSIDDCRKGLRVTLNHVVFACDDTCAFHLFDDVSRAMMTQITHSEKEQQFAQDEDVKVPRVECSDVKQAAAPAAPVITAAPRSELGESPLGGWPVIAQDEPQRPVAAAETWEEIVDVGRDLVEGTRVLFKNLQAKSGVTGVLLQKYSNDRWKVAMEDGSGNAVLKARYLIALA